jgi:hypothetical protein
MTPDEIEDLPGSLVAMEADAPSPRVYVERELGPVIVDLRRGRDGRIGDIPLSQAPERITDEGLTGGQLSLIVQMLELTTTAFVDHVVRAPGLNPQRRRLHYTAKTTPSESLVVAKISKLHQIVRCGSRYERGLAIGKVSNAVTAGSQAENTKLRHRSPSLRACFSHALAATPASGASAGRRLSRFWCSTNAAATARC